MTETACQSRDCRTGDPDMWTMTHRTGLTILVCTDHAAALQDDGWDAQLTAGPDFERLQAIGQQEGHLQDGRQSVAALEAADTPAEVGEVPAWMLESPVTSTERPPLPPPTTAGWWTLPLAAWAWTGDAHDLEN